MISISELDTQRFGIKTARVDDVKINDLPNMESFCRDHQVRLLIARCDTQELSAVHALEQAGATLMDTLVYFVLDLANHTLPAGLSGTYEIAEMQANDTSEIIAIAAEAFADYAQGHYHNDPALENAACRDAYMDWAQRACAGHSAQCPVLVARKASEIVGFLTLEPRDEVTTELVLGGVKKSYQRHGVYRLLIAAGVNVAVRQNKNRVHTSTQLANIAVQKVWIRLGFEPAGSAYTFHKWYR